MQWFLCFLQLKSSIYIIIIIISYLLVVLCGGDGSHIDVVVILISCMLKT